MPVNKLKISCIDCKAGIFRFTLIDEFVKCSICGLVQKNPHWNGTRELFS